MKINSLPIVFSSCLLLVGCGNQYWTRNDAIYQHTGDAVRSNIAVQIPDPWPKKSENTNIPMDPVKSQYAVECYRLGKRPSDSLGSSTFGYGASPATVGGIGASQTTCQATDAKPSAPVGTQNYNVESNGNAPPPTITLEKNNTPQ